jgi:hypothetical protein
MCNCYSSYQPTQPEYHPPEHWVKNDGDWRVVFLKKSPDTIVPCHPEMLSMEPGWPELRLYCG